MSAVPATISPGSRGGLQFTDEKKELIRKTVAKDLTPNEFEFFMSVAGARGLDPILGQIHAVIRGKDDKAKLIIQIGIDGFRTIAARTGEYAGSDKTVFHYNTNRQLMSAEVTVYRMIGGVRCAWTGEAHWDEFCPKDPKMRFMWDDKPRVMLGKCAEAQALRKAFPNDLGGMYEEAELAREVVEVVPEKQASALEAPSDEAKTKVAEILGKFRQLGVSADQICKYFDIFDTSVLVDQDLKVLNDIGAAIVLKKKKKEDFFPPVGAR